MMLLDSILDIFKEQRAEFGSLTPHNLCIMKAPLVGTNSIINNDGSLTTWIAINGSYHMMGDQKFAEFEEYLLEKLIGPLKIKGRSISVSYNKDNFLTKNRLKEATSNARRKIDLGFKTNEIIKQQEDILSSKISYEQAYLSITTSPDIQPKNTAKKSIKNARQAFREASKKYMQSAQANYTQMPKIFIKEIIKSHDSFVNNVENVLKRYLDVEILDPEEVIRELRTFYFPEAVTPHYKARIVGNSATIDVSDSKEFVSAKSEKLIVQTDKKGENNDISNLLYPSIAEQVVLSNSEIDDENARKSGVRGVVRIGARYYAPILISSPPENHTRFDDLFNSIDFRIPFRFAMNLQTGNDKFIRKLNSIKGKATMLAITNSDNKRIKEACEVLVEDYKNGNDIPLNTYMLFLTWGRTPEETDANRDNIMSSIQSWGSADAIPEYGDPYISAMEAMPGFSQKRTAPGFIQGLTEVIRMLPYTRPSSPWKNGEIMFYTKEHKMWNYSIGSSVQATWIELISAGPGSGKSVYMAGSNLSLVTSSPERSLPKIGIIDVGPSSKYMIDFVKSILPEDMKDEVASYRIKMDNTYAFNPFDTLLGCRYPVANDRSFLINFLTLVLRPVDANTAEIGTTELVSLLVDEAYKTLDPNVNRETSRKYAQNQIPELEEAIIRHDLDVSNRTTLYEIVDKLMELEDYKTANLVQRHAVPRLDDLSSVLTQSRVIQDQYSDERSKALKVLFSNQINFAITAYPIISLPTVFDIGNSSIVSLDLGEIVQSGTDNPQSKRTAEITYMLARYMIGKNYYRDKDTVEESAVPKKYKEYHRRWIEKEHVRLKRLCMDEFHTTNGNDSILNQVHMDCRTGRKYNVVVTLVSQRDADFSETLRELATTTMIMGGSSSATRNKQIKEYDLDADTGYALKNFLNAPNRNGSSMIIFGSAKSGNFTQMIYYLLPPIIMWGMATTTEDVALRDYTIMREGDYIKAMTKLSYVFRQGTSKSIYESYKNNFIGEVPKNSSVDNEVARLIYENEVSKIKIDEDGVVKQ